MLETERTAQFRKDREQEQRLQEMNTLLSPLEKRLIAQFSKPSLPIVFIVGSPRSCTTLLAQLLAETGAFSYVSNFVARFWMAPYVGTLIENALGARSSPLQQTFVSQYGVTEGWHSPHEFGYFWGRWFSFGDTHKLSPDQLAQIDSVSLCREIAALESFDNKSLFFKNLTCGLQITFLAKLLDRSIFVLCQRHALYNMQSLLMARKKVLGDSRAWFSLKPKEYLQLLSRTPYEQVAGQIYFTLKDIETSAGALSPQRFVRVHYDDLCSQPRAEVGKIVEVVCQLGGNVDWEPTSIPERFQSTDVQRVSDEEFETLREATKRWFG